MPAFSDSIKGKVNENPPRFATRVAVPVCPVRVNLPMPADQLSQRLFASVSADFFRPLVRPSAPVYVDGADRLIKEAGESGRLPQSDALAILREVLSQNPQIALQEDEGGGLQDVRARAGKLFNQMLQVRWIEDQAVSLNERWVVISPSLRPLMRTLHDLAETEVAELKSFADTLRGVCTTLEQRDSLNPHAVSSHDMRGTVHDLLQRMEHAILQLHGVEKLIHSYERRQRETQSGAETLRLFYHEFHEGQHMVCYDVLRSGGLLPRLQRARARVRDAAENMLIIQHLADGIAEYRNLEQPEAWELAAAQLQRLERQLSGLRLRAEAIDARVASFNRLSVQRYRYQSELRGRRPDMIKNYCDAINAAHRGSKFNELRIEPDFTLATPEVDFFYGIASLARPRRSRSPVALELGESLSAEDEAADLERLRQRQKFALTPHRAARLVARLLKEHGPGIATDGFSMETADELLDLMAAAAYNHGVDATSGEEQRWQIISSSRENGLEPNNIPRDAQAGWRVERFAFARPS